MTMVKTMMEISWDIMDKIMVIIDTMINYL